MNSTMSGAPSRDMFSDLANEWTRETGMLASPQRRHLHRCYQLIVGMGPVAIPWLLERLRDEPDDWFWALTAVTGGIDPPHGNPSFRESRDAWLVWGHDAGFLP